MARGEGKECSCKITSVALICLPTHLCGSLRRSLCCSLYPGVPSCFVPFLLFSGSLFSFLSSFTLFPSACLLLTFEVYYHLILYSVWSIQCWKCFLACVLLNHAYTIICSSLYCFSLIILTAGVPGQRRQSVVKISPRGWRLLFQAKILVQSLKWKLC